MCNKTYSAFKKLLGRHFPSPKLGHRALGSGEHGEGHNSTTPEESLDHLLGTCGRLFSKS